ncbi:Cyclase-associated protein 1 [Capsicum annuum]|nr:Cyclase-associated protein 1 [Capsicum annuum]
MDEKLIQRLESAVIRLEALSVGGGASVGDGVAAAALDPSIIAFDDLRSQFVGRVLGAAEKIGGQVLDVTKIVEEAFEAQRELLIKIKETQKPSMSGLPEFLKPLNDVILKATKMTEGWRLDFFNHLKAAVDSLIALAWIAYTGKDCGMSMPIAHVEESWQMAEFYNNKVQFLAETNTTPGVFFLSVLALVDRVTWYRLPMGGGRIGSWSGARVESRVRSQGRVSDRESGLYLESGVKVRCRGLDSGFRVGSLGWISGQESKLGLGVKSGVGVGSGANVGLGVGSGFGLEPIVGVGSRVGCWGRVSGRVPRLRVRVRSQGRVSVRELGSDLGLGVGVESRVGSQGQVLGRESRLGIGVGSRVESQGGVSSWVLGSSLGSGVVVLVEFRNKDPNHIEWAKALKELYLPGLWDYVKSHYPLGPVWSATGKVAVSAPSKAPLPTSRPMPPPLPPASLFSSGSFQASSSRPKKGMAAVFDEINSGKPVTTGLRKVTDDMKTKNRADRTGVISAGEKEGRLSSPSFSKAGPPKLELQMGRKWMVENQIGRKNLVIDDCDAKQSVYIFGCKDSVLQIQGKVNNITIDKCTKMGVVFTDVVAACEVVNCNGVEMQCQGSAPTISVDNTTGCQLYLGKDSSETSITTAKSSEINVLVPGAGPDSDWCLKHYSGYNFHHLKTGEHALPQQFSHVYKNGQFVTTSVSHSGGEAIPVMLISQLPLSDSFLLETKLAFD